ncbi:MAG: hypothetical protein ACJAYY_002035, partial [Paraglaciecola sp.]
VNVSQEKQFLKNISNDMKLEENRIRKYLK